VKGNDISETNVNVNSFMESMEEFGKKSEKPKKETKGKVKLSVIVEEDQDNNNFKYEYEFLKKLI